MSLNKTFWLQIAMQIFGVQSAGLPRILGEWINQKARVSSSKREQGRATASEIFPDERATIHTIESKRAKFKTAHDFLCATACGASRVLAITEASVCLSVTLLSTIYTSVKRTSFTNSAIVSKWCKLGSQNLHCQLVSCQPATNDHDAPGYLTFWKRHV